MDKMKFYHFLFLCCVVKSLCEKTEDCVHELGSLNEQIKKLEAEAVEIKKDFEKFIKTTFNMSLSDNVTKTTQTAGAPFLEIEETIQTTVEAQVCFTVITK